MSNCVGLLNDQRCQKLRLKKRPFLSKFLRDFVDQFFLYFFLLLRVYFWEPKVSPCGFDSTNPVSHPSHRIQMHHMKGAVEISSKVFANLRNKFKFFYKRAKTKSKQYQKVQNKKVRTDIFFHPFFFILVLFHFLVFSFIIFIHFNFVTLLCLFVCLLVVAFVQSIDKTIDKSN